MSTDTGPEFVLESNIKHHEGLASSMRADAERALERAAVADVMAERFRAALEKLRKGE